MADRLTYADYGRLARLGDEQLQHQCQVETFHATGPGGQGVNTADSAVRMRHLPTGIVVVSRESRSQHLNRLACLAKLRDELARRARPPKVRHATKPTRGSKERRLKEKRVRSEVKRLRRRPGRED